MSHNYITPGELPVRKLKLCRSYLHGHESIVHQNFLGEEVRTYGSLVACAKLLVDLLFSVEPRAMYSCVWERGDGAVHIGS